MNWMTRELNSQFGFPPANNLGLPTPWRAQPRQAARSGGMSSLTEIAVETVSNASNIFVFPHLEKNGGTSLSLVLAMATQVICGSAASAGWCWKQLCRSPSCVFVTGLAWHEGMSEFSSDQWQRNRLAHVQKLSYRHGLSPSRALQSAFAHERPSVLRYMFPQSRMLLLFRSPDAHRHSFFHAQRWRWPDETNFSTWIRSDSYVHALATQLLWAQNALSDAAGPPPPLESATRGVPDAKTTALALLEHEHIAWVGLLEQWDSSMCLLARALGLASTTSFYDFARDVHTRWYPRTEAMNAVHVAVGLPDEDFNLLLKLEAAEWRFVSLLSRVITDRIAQEGLCKCTPVREGNGAMSMTAEG